MPEELINKVIEKASEVADAVSDLRDAGSEILNEKIEEITGSLQIISRSGFSLEDIGVKLGLPPEVGGTFVFQKEVSNEEWEELLAETENKQTLNSLLNSLFRAQSLVEKMKLGNFKLDSVDIVLGIPPGIGLKFKPKNGKTE